MNLQNTVKNCLYKNPALFQNALDVYEHLFCVNGNGYKWINGELIYEDDDVIVYDSTNDAIIKYLQDRLVDYPKVMYRSIKNNIGTHYFRNLIHEIKIISNVDNSLKDFTPLDIVDNFIRKFEFYPLSKYSKMCCFPDDIKPDWFEGIKKMVEIMENNLNRLGDKDNDKIWLEKIKEKIKNHKFNNI